MVPNLFTGIYTKEIGDYKLTVPFKVNLHGNFSSFAIPSFYQHDFNKQNRRKRSIFDPEIIHYVIHFDGNNHHAELWPNHGLVSPNALFENYEPRTKVVDKKIRKLDEKKMCHYTGQIRGQPSSKVALSTCNGLVSLIF